MLPNFSWFVFLFSIISTALMGTCLIFISFSLAALYNTNRMFMYMGGKAAFYSNNMLLLSSTDFSISYNRWHDYRILTYLI